MAGCIPFLSVIDASATRLSLLFLRLAARTGDNPSNVHLLHNAEDTRIMPQRKKKTTSVPKTTISVDRLARALAKRRKAELIEIIVEIACADRGIMRQLAIQFSVEVLPKELVAETRQAMDEATEFDERVE